MSFYKNAFHIQSNDDGQRIELAKKLLSNGDGIVFVDNCFALRLIKEGLLCEVLAHSLNNKSQYEEMIDQAKGILTSSTLANFIANKKLIWTIVEDYGMGVADLWCERQ